MLKLSQILQNIQLIFEQNQLPPNHLQEAEWILSNVLKISRTELYLRLSEIITTKEQKKIDQIVYRRLQREPLAYILKECYFWTFKLFVDQNVLIPRPETEIIVEEALKTLPQSQSSPTPYRILELGTGSGAIPLALAHERQNLEIITVDNQVKALKIAQQNFNYYQPLLKKKNNTIHVVNSNLFKEISSSTKFNLIISNPPYIKQAELDHLMPEVKNWEPLQALDGDFDGLKFYRYLFSVINQYLQTAGFLVIEHGALQAADIYQISLQYEELILKKQLKDLQGLDRGQIYQKVA